MGEDEKSLIVAGDQQILVEFLRQIMLRDAAGKSVHESDEGVEAEEIKAEARPVDIAALDPNKDLTKTESCLEFLLVSLSRAFGLQPKRVCNFCFILDRPPVC